MARWAGFDTRNSMNTSSRDASVTVGLTVKTSKLAVPPLQTNQDDDQGASSQRSSFIDISEGDDVKTLHSINDSTQDATKSSADAGGSNAQQGHGSQGNESPNTVLPIHGQYSSMGSDIFHHNSSPRNHGRMAYTPIMVYPPAQGSRYNADGVHPPPSPLMGSPVSTPTAMMFPQTPFAGAHHHSPLSPSAAGAFHSFGPGSYRSNPFARDMPGSPQHSGHYGYFHPMFNNFPPCMPLNRGSSLVRNGSGSYRGHASSVQTVDIGKRKPSTNRADPGGSAHMPNHDGSAMPQVPQHNLMAGNVVPGSLHGPMAYAPSSDSGQPGSVLQLPPAYKEGVTMAATNWAPLAEDDAMAGAEQQAGLAAGLGMGYPFQQPPQMHMQDAVPMMPWGMGMPQMDMAQVPMQPIQVHPYHYQMLVMAAAQNMPLLPSQTQQQLMGLPQLAEAAAYTSAFPLADLSASGQVPHAYAPPADPRNGMVFVPPPPPPATVLPGAGGVMNVAPSMASHFGQGPSAFGQGAAAFGQGQVLFANGMPAYGQMPPAYGQVPPAKPVRRRNASELKVGPDGMPRLNARQRRTLRRAKERALKGLMEAGHVLLQRHGHLFTASGTDSSGGGGDSSAEEEEEDTNAAVSKDTQHQTEMFPGASKAADKTELYLGAAISVASGSAGPKAAAEAAEALSKAAADLDDMDISSLISQLTHKKDEAAVDDKLIRDLQIIQNLIGALKMDGTKKQPAQGSGSKAVQHAGSPLRPPASSPKPMQPLHGAAMQQQEAGAVAQPAAATAAAAAFGMLPPELQGLGEQMKAIMEGKGLAASGESKSAGIPGMSAAAGILAAADAASSASAAAAAGPPPQLPPASVAALMLAMRPPVHAAVQPMSAAAQLLASIPGAMPSASALLPSPHLPEGQGVRHRSSAMGN